MSVTLFGSINTCWFEYAECTLTIPTYVGVDPEGFIRVAGSLCDFLSPKRNNRPSPPPATHQKTHQKIRNDIILIRLSHRRLVVHSIRIRGDNRIHHPPPIFIIILACRLPPAGAICYDGEGGDDDDYVDVFVDVNRCRC